MSNALALNLNAKLNVSEQSIDSYIQAVKAIPTLSEVEEKQLTFRLFDEGDVEAAKQLVISHLRFVLYIAQGYRGYGLPLADLVQEGNIGLMKAIKRFDPNVGVRLVSFAVHWIRAEIHEFILKNWRIVKVATTKAQRKLFFNLRSSKKRLGWLSHAEVQKVAADLGVAPKDVLEMEKRMSSTDTAFDAPADMDDDDFIATPAGYLEDHRYDPATMVEDNQWENQQSEKLHEVFATLDERSRDILQRRWLDEDSKTTLQDLADKYKVSAERIRQIENSAIKKMRKQMI